MAELGFDEGQATTGTFITSLIGWAKAQVTKYITTATQFIVGLLFTTVTNTDPSSTNAQADPIILVIGDDPLNEVIDLMGEIADPQTAGYPQIYRKNGNNVEVWNGKTQTWNQVTSL